MEEHLFEYEKQQIMDCIINNISVEECSRITAIPEDIVRSYYIKSKGE